MEQEMLYPVSEIPPSKPSLLCKYKYHIAGSVLVFVLVIVAIVFIWAFVFAEKEPAATQKNKNNPELPQRNNNISGEMRQQISQEFREGMNFLNNRINELESKLSKVNPARQESSKSNLNDDLNNEARNN